jgi:hypothetical protein
MMIAKAELKPHPTADLFPEMPKTDYRKFSADIAANGLREEIVTYQGQILDGRHRYRACLDNGIEPCFREYQGDDPVGFVVSMNGHRRHLTKSQRAMVAAKLADLKPGGDRSKPQNCAVTHAKAAALLNISERLVDQASALRNAVANGRAGAELLEHVDANRISLNRAEKIARLPKDEQRQQIVALSSAGLAQTSSRRARLQWADQSDKIGQSAELLSSRVAKLAGRAEKAGKSTPEFKMRLAWVCWRAAQLFSAAAVHLDRASGRSAVCRSRESRKPKGADRDTAKAVENKRSRYHIVELATPASEDWRRDRTADHD